MFYSGTEWLCYSVILTVVLHSAEIMCYSVIVLLHCVESYCVIVLLSGCVTV
jgi:hypothetical protein